MMKWNKNLSTRAANCLLDIYYWGARFGWNKKVPEIRNLMDRTEEEVRSLVKGHLEDKTLVLMGIRNIGKMTAKEIETWCGYSNPEKVIKTKGQLERELKEVWDVLDELAKLVELARKQEYSINPFTCQAYQILNIKYRGDNGKI